MYRDIQDINADRDRAAQKGATQHTAQQTASLRDRDTRMRSGMYGNDSRLHKVDQLVTAKATRAGVVDEPELAKLREAARERFAPLLKENPEIDDRLLGHLLAANPVPASQIQERTDALINLVRRPLESRDATVARIDEFNQSLRTARPLLNEHLKTTGAGSVPMVVRALLEAEDTYTKPAA